MILINSFGSTIISPHFLHFTVSNGSYMGMRTLTLFGIEDKKEGSLVISLRLAFH